MHEYKKLKELGSGSFGNVILVSHKDGPADQRFAMKMIKMDGLKAKDRDAALNEIRLLASIDSPHVVSYKTAFFDEKSNMLCIVMEYADGGDLAGLIKKKRDKQLRFNENFIWELAYDILRGLKTLHNSNILHRDIKPGNIFMSNGIAKLGDLNVSKVMEGNFATTQTGTPYYTSPEIWDCKPYNSKCDIWSLGCVLYETACHKPPFLGKDFPELIRKINKGLYLPLPSFYSKQLGEFIKNCLSVDPEHRPNTEQLLTAEIFRMIDQPEQRGEVNLLKPIRCPPLLHLIEKQLPKSKSGKPIGSFKSIKNLTGSAELQLRPLQTSNMKINCSQNLDDPMSEYSNQEHLVRTPNRYGRPQPRLQTVSPISPRTQFKNNHPHPEGYQIDRNYLPPPKLQNDLSKSPNREMQKIEGPKRYVLNPNRDLTGHEQVSTKANQKSHQGLAYRGNMIRIERHL